MTLRMTRRQYADLYGPTAGDRVRLADTDLLIRIERDLTVPGEEAKSAGGLDSHIHFICPQIVTEAVSAGLTTLLGGGTGPATGTASTTCTPGEWNIHRMLEAAEEFPVNLGFLGKGNASAPDPLREQIA